MNKEEVTVKIVCDSCGSSIDEREYSQYVIDVGGFPALSGELHVQCGRALFKSILGILQGVREEKADD